jgi:uncharacterized protein YbaR (Trm112 family)/SAM-dependent methyltransferase
MDLYSILACPTCKIGVQRRGDSLVCPKCECVYPIVNGVPVLLPGGSVPSTEYQHELHTRPTYDPWVHRVVVQSLPASAIMLDLGAGNLTLDLPNVVRMDVTLTPYVDVVGDAHALPFLPGTFDFVFSLAVIEHLRQPFHAAEEMYRVLRNGGYVYGECNFVFAYHGYPHHYFNASQQGLEQVFASFEKFRSGVAPYQMPSAAVRMLLDSYLKWMQPSGEPDAQAFRLLLREVLEQPLATYDGLFTEEGALNVAAGVFFFGRKRLAEPSDVIPRVVQDVWEREPSVSARFPRPFDIGTVPNIMLWAKEEGRQQFSDLDEYFQSLVPFRKHGKEDATSRELFDALPVIAPEFGNIPDPNPHQTASTGDTALQQRLEKVAARNERLEAAITERDTYIKHLTSFSDEKVAYIKRLEALVRERDVQIGALEAVVRRGRSNPVGRIRQFLKGRRAR